MVFRLFSRRVTTDESPIREFAYLDEVSVESLLASVDGEVLVQRTSTESRSSEAGLGGSVGASTPFGKASFAPTLKQTRGNEVQELRKSVAQSAFARFRNKNFNRFVIRPLRLPVSKRIQRKIHDRDPKALRKYGQGLPLRDLQRGDLLEIETTIAAADIFKVRTAVSAITDVVDANPSFLTTELRDQLDLAKPLVTLIDSLNGDAIPVRGEAASVTIADVAGEPWLVSASANPGTTGRSVTLESQTFARWFWGDVGRILFRPARYKMLCRILSADIRDSPTNSYVGSILRTVSEDLAETVDGLGSTFLSALRAGHQEAVGVGGPTSVREVIIRYLQLVSELAGVDQLVLSPEEMKAFARIDVKQLAVSAQAEFFRGIDNAIALDPSVVSEVARADLRDAVRTEFGLWPWSEGPQLEDTEAEPEALPLLEVAIVAVYW
ncbi:hypothetical protein [Curtobacterium sp. ME12]|uniref:DUF6414 family protein n=1 Tax=Curtobacterium sp. ME12 TaxID=2744253 RepID=UPI0015F6E755|nr:hypothetical protein [Curtobacterium sp. ME12]